MRRSLRDVQAPRSCGFAMQLALLLHPVLTLAQANALPDVDLRPLATFVARPGRRASGHVYLIAANAFERPLRGGLSMTVPCSAMA